MLLVTCFLLWQSILGNKCTFYYMKAQYLVWDTGWSVCVMESECGRGEGKALCWFNWAVLSSVVMEWRQLSLRMPPSSSAVALPLGQLFPPHTHTAGCKRPGLCERGVGGGGWLSWWGGPWCPHSGNPCLQYNTPAPWPWTWTLERISMCVSADDIMNEHLLFQQE